MSDEGRTSGLFDEDLALSAAVGTSEIELRRSMGNEHFDAYMAWVDENRANGVILDKANNAFVIARAQLYAAVAAAIPLLVLLVGIVSIFSMVMWALH